MCRLLIQVCPKHTALCDRRGNCCDDLKGCNLGIVMVPFRKASLQVVPHGDYGRSLLHPRGVLASRMVVCQLFHADGLPELTAPMVENLRSQTVVRELGPFPANTRRLVVLYRRPSEAD